VAILYSSHTHWPATHSGFIDKPLPCLTCKKKPTGLDVKFSCTLSKNATIWSQSGALHYYWGMQKSISEYTCRTLVKGILHPKISILSSFVSNLYEFLSSAEHKAKCFCIIFQYFFGTLAPLTSIVFFFSYMEVNGAKQLFGSNPSSKYLHLCSAEERNSLRFAKTWLFIFGWSFPLRQIGYSCRRPHQVPLLWAKNRKLRLHFTWAYQN